jgi:hypothetical protein
LDKVFEGRIEIQGQNGQGVVKQMKYMLLIYHDEQAWDSIGERERQQIYGEYRQLREQITTSGHYLDGSQLHSIRSARSIRVRDDKPLVTEGPFAETREQLGGYFLIDARDIEKATAIASRIPSARMGTIEVRPLVETGAPTTA